MANYKRSGGNGIALKIYAAITSILLAAAIVLTSCAFALDWVKLPAQDEPAQEQPDEGGMEINESEEQGLSLMSASISPEDFADYGVSPLAESAYTVTATVTPELAVNKAVDWSVSWKNASSSWATGKTVTDYVTVTPTSDGALTASVACIKEFAEQIIVTATSRDNSDAKGTCTVDYRQKYIGTETSLSFNNSTYTHNGAVSTNIANTGNASCPNRTGTGYNTNNEYSPENSMTYTVKLSDTYTIALENSAISFKYYVKLNPEFASALKSASSINFTDSAMATDWTLFDETTGNLNDGLETSGINSESLYKMTDYYYTICHSLRTAAAPYVYCFDACLNDFIEVAQNYVSSYHFQVKVVAKYDDASYETVSNVTFSEDSLLIRATNVSVGPDIVF